MLLSSPSNTFNRLLGRDREIGRLCFNAKPALGALLASLTARAPSNHNQCTQRLCRSFYGVPTLFGVIFCCRFSNQRTEDHTILHWSEMLLGQKGKIISKPMTLSHHHGDGVTSSMGKIGPTRLNPKHNDCNHSALLHRALHKGPCDLALLKLQYPTQ